MSKLRIQWLTDMHLSFCRPLIPAVIAQLLRIDPDILLIGGDIGEANNFDDFLKALASKFNKPVMYVLGNHDFYGSSVETVREKASSLHSYYPNLHYLTSINEPIQLNDDTCLIGHDGWADGRAGNYWTSKVQLADQEYIMNYKFLSYSDVFKVMNKFGDEAANNIAGKLKKSVKEYKHTIILTHVPPFQKGSFHAGKPSDNEWAPYFVGREMGDKIIEVASKHPKHNITILCGHTHGSGIYKPLPWVTSINGRADYGKVIFQDLITI